MKKIFRVNIVLLLICLVSCDDSLLDTKPTTTITETNFFANAKDLETYTNGMYSMIGASINDLSTDNISHYNSGGEMEKLLRGDVNYTNVGGWSWSSLRKINFMLERIDKVNDSEENINHYVGIAKFFRAMFYIDMVKKYSDIPWYEKTLTTDDVDNLYKKKDSRDFVVNKIFEDLDFACKNIFEDGHKTRITKWAALALKTRFALYEASYRKYHKYLNLTDSQKYYDIVVASATEIMGSSRFSISTSNDESEYRKLFTSTTSLNSNSSVILFQDYEKDKRNNNIHVVLDYEYALSRDLVDDFLMKDGTSFRSKLGNDTMMLKSVFVDRDPRLKAIMMQPGFQSPAETKPHRLKPSLGGYCQIKYYPTTEDQISWGKGYTDLPVYRYAEILLSFAEAKAELGSISQTDINNTVNLIRKRVGVADLNLANANANPDSHLAQKNPNVTGANKGVILEIRRERRTEFACEGIRYDDIHRWKLGKLMETKFEGMYIPKLGAYDFTGDGIEDIAILNNEGEKATLLAHLTDEVKEALSYYYLDSEQTTIYLSGGTKGRIMFKSDKNPKTFIEPKYYYRPIPREQMQLNENLTQPLGWESEGK
jgi:hypothetical protein